MAKTQTLSFPIRLPDAMQAEALRLLDASRLAINEIILELWPQLDRFAGERAGPAWKKIKEQVRALRAQMQDAGEDLDSFMAMTNVLEQACNRYLQTEEFPTSYEDLQPVPVQEVAQLTFAGDDGMKVGQTYRARIEVTQF